MNENLSGHYSLKTEELKVQLGNPKSGRGRFPERSLTTTAFHDKFKVTVQTGFHKGGRN